MAIRYEARLALNADKTTEPINITLPEYLKPQLDGLECAVFGVQGKAIMTSNGYSIPRSYNAALRPKNRAILPVADSPDG